jgi:hypothetical protein
MGTSCGTRWDLTMEKLEAFKEIDVNILGTWGTLEL